VGFTLAAAISFPLERGMTTLRNEAMTKANQSGDLPIADRRYYRRLASEIVPRLSRIDDWRNALVLVRQWIIMVAAATIAIYFDRWFIYGIAALTIGTRLQFLAVLMHDACHWTLFTNRSVNDFVGNVFVAYPLGLDLQLYRASHFRHHRFINTSEDRDYQFQTTDPDQRFPKSPPQMAWLLLKSAAQLNVFPMLRFARFWVPALNLHNPRHLDINYSLAMRMRYVTWAIIVYGTISWSPYAAPIFGMYLVPLAVWSNLFNRIRAMAEHNGLPEIDELGGTRTVIPTLLDRLLIAPFNVCYHIEHHLFPTVPGRNLKAMHLHLRQDEHYCKHAHVTYGYWGVLREVTTWSRV
jgi:fatty acid desaturase